MSKSHRILIFEDNASDAELMKRALRKSGLDFQAHLAADKDSFLAALNDFVPDLILADFSVPGFDGLAALDSARRHIADIPLIIVSGAIGEEVAVETLKAGATDYVLKDALTRLGPAVHRAIEEAERLAEKKEQEARYRTLFERSPDGVLIIDPETAVAIEFNEAAHRQLGYSRREFAKLRIGDYEVLEKPEETTARVLGDGRDFFETKHRTKNNEIRDVSVSVQTITLAGRKVFMAIFRDITERKQSERVQQRLLAEERRAKELSDDLNKINAMIGSTLDINEILQQAVTESRKTIKSESSLVVLREGDRWVIKFVDGLPKATVGTELADEAVEPSRLAAREGSPVVIEDATSDPRITPELAQTLDLRSLIAVPLLSRGDIIGGISFNQHSTTRVFSAVEVDFAAKLASSLSLALENARLFKAEVLAQEQARSELDVSDQLLRAADVLASQTSLERTLSLLVQIVAQFTGRSRVAINLIDMKKSIMEVGASTGEYAVVGTTIDIDKIFGPVWRKIVDRQSTVMDYDKADLSPADRRRFAAGRRLALYVPIAIAGEVTALIVVDEPKQRRDFTGREIRLVEGIADQAAVAIERSRLFESEHRIAATLQESLLAVPERIEGLEFGHIYRSATVETALVGGDFYDIFELEDGRVGILIGDVSGKGLEAATLTSIIKSTVKAYTYQRFTPAFVLMHTNDALMKRVDIRQFVTAFFGIIDTHTGAIVYANAGHPPAILKSAEGVSYLSSGSLPLGILPDTQYTEKSARLGENDLLVLYTDGVTEGRRGKKFFGEERLLNIVKAAKPELVKDFPQVVLDKLMKFTAGALSDDVAILAVTAATPKRASKASR